MRISDWSSDVCSSDLTGYSPTHFQRVFTRHTGLSPAAYARALREERARQALSAGSRVTDAIYDAGFSGPSRFYDMLEGRMGMTASAWEIGRAWGRGRVCKVGEVPGVDGYIKQKTI